MKRFSWLLLAALPVLFISCQKEVAKDARTLNVAPRTAANCSTCVANWEDSKETVLADDNANYYVDVANDAASVYITIYRTGTGKFTKAKNILVKQGAVTLYNVAGPIGAGSTSTLSLPAIAFSELVACSPITISLETVGVGGGGGKVITDVVYYLRKKCEIVTCDLTGYRTQTRGFWGNSPVGIGYLSANWASAQPTLLGCETGASATFASAADPTAFIASNTGTPGVLPNGGTFAAQVLTLAINVNLDKNLATFGSGKLGCTIVDVDPLSPLAIWNGYSVATILDIANDILGGCANNYTASQMTDIVDAINKNFDNGTVNLGVLTCGVCP